MGSDPRWGRCRCICPDRNKGMTASFMNYGANLLTLFVPDKNGKTKDIVLGYEHLEDYFTNDAFFGCSVVPCGNRIGDARFTLNSKTYELDKNDGVNNLHSGFHPLCRRIWDVDAVSENSITFSYKKKDMDMGFPGNGHLYRYIYPDTGDGIAH